MDNNEILKPELHWKQCRFTPKSLVKYYQQLIDDGVISPDGAGANRMNQFKFKG